MLLSIHDGRIQEYNNSIKILSALEFDALLLVYLSISLNNGKEHIKKASSYFEKGMIPPNLSKALRGPKIYFKRDDLTGLAFGGNKTRMFDFIMAKVLNEGYDCVVGVGECSASQSNYSRQMAAACAKLGLDYYLFFAPGKGRKIF